MYFPQVQFTYLWGFITRKNWENFRSKKYYTLECENMNLGKCMKQMKLNANEAQKKMT